MATATKSVSTRGLWALKRCEGIVNSLLTSPTSIFSDALLKDCTAVIKNTWSKTKPTVLVLEIKDSTHFTDYHVVSVPLIDLDGAVECYAKHWLDYKDDQVFFEHKIDDILSESIGEY
tara:strand:- start:1879 stop:2232 length:354 start_codon:yes stop_codon:yes gene_type:complete